VKLASYHLLRNVDNGFGVVVKFSGNEMQIEYAIASYNSNLEIGIRLLETFGRCFLWL
jgi:hypothetical protein